MYRNVLVVLPHPDDETFGSGGTIALLAKEGARVTYLCGTRGEMGRNMGRPFFANRETLPDLREKELREACRVLGVAELRLMGLRDKTVEFVDPEQLSATVGAHIAEIKPDLILTHHPKHGVHPDHNALGGATIRAVAAMPADRRPPVWVSGGGSGIGELGEPDVQMDISSVGEIKQAAIDAHRSQSEVFSATSWAKWQHDPAMKERMAMRLKRERFWTYRFN